MIGTPAFPIFHVQPVISGKSNREQVPGKSARSRWSNAQRHAVVSLTVPNREAFAVEVVLPPSLSPTACRVEHAGTEEFESSQLWIATISFGPVRSRAMEL